MTTKGDIALYMTAGFLVGVAFMLIILQLAPDKLLGLRFGGG